ncbi:MAG TPA: hypothetical protein VGQ76_06080 [Thermoanaerobaculia bacterium]|jgi:hypothetical protein|nr:hypothetical protein [Thermoanaerobaculia bacterium]
MNRRSFGFWGVDLSPADFACALAEAGIVEGDEKLLIWRLSADHLPILRNSDNGKEYAERWKLRGGNPRIEIDPAFDTRQIVDAAWVFETLSIPEVGAGAVYIRAEEPVAKVVLEWPLRIGVLPSTEASVLLKEFRQYHYADKLVTFVELSDAERECDVLVLPFALRQSVAHLAAAPFPVRCDLAIILGPTDASARSAMSLVGAIRSLSRGAGVALAPTAEKMRGYWFGRFIDEISHNHPLDVALRRASPNRNSPPMVVASRLLAQWTLARRVEIVRQKIAARPRRRGTSIDLSEHTAYTLDLPRSATFDQIEGRLEKADERSWEAESDMATASAEIVASAAEALSEPATVEPRWIQAKVFADDAPVEHQFRWRAPHEVRVRIGPDDKNWLHGEGVFPDHLLPDQEREHLLTVIFFVPQPLSEPQLGTILLPRSGESSTISFFFKPFAAGPFEARITVLYQNRVLQTALLKGTVTKDEPDASAKIEVVTEAVIRPGMYDLSSMERGDAAIVINESVTGESGALKTGAGRASYVSLDDLKGEIDWFDDQLSAIADDPDSYDGLFAPATVQMLVDFAQHGSLLYAHLTDSKDFEKLTDAERIQIVAAKAEARFPIEFVYDRELEMGVNALCANAVDALLTGKCDADHSGLVICPLGFWGLRKVIERHIHDPNIDLPASADFELRAVPVDGRTRLDVLKAALLAASNKVDAVAAGGIARVQNALGSIVSIPPVFIDNWQDWENGVKTAPTLLVLIVHVEEEANHLQKMEIGDQEFLGAAFLKSKFIRDPSTNPAPLVLLLGCETGAADLSFQGFVAQFRRGGAAVVISSGSTVLGRHVVPVTEELLAQLKVLSSGEKTSIGEAMRAIRRSMLAKGMPMVLALNAYGDADWRLA